MATTEPAPQSVPYDDQAFPGLGRNGGLLEEQRRQSGGLSDDPPDNPVRDDLPFKLNP